jgi:hypothetical protein
MVFDVHDRAFAFFKGAAHGGNDITNTAVEAIFVGPTGNIVAVFLRCARFVWSSRPLYAPVGSEEGQAENQVGLIRARFFAPRLRATLLRTSRFFTILSRSLVSGEQAGSPGGIHQPPGSRARGTMLP